MKLPRLQYLLIFTTGLLLVLPHVTLAQGVLESLNQTAQNLVFNIVMGILGMFVWLAALLLNFSVNNFIIGFGNTFANTGVGVAVDNVWVIVRDFVNLTFIFGFVYIGFKMILNSSDSNTRRWLVNIILAALLVNFSLFVVKFAIDMSNQLAAQIAINGLGTTCTGDSCVTESGLRQVDIASEFMARLGLSKVFSLTWENINGAGWGYIFGSALLSLTAMFVFAAGGILIIIRFAILCLFMVMSPVMFLSWILPPMKDTFERFWSMFIGRALFAPIYLLFIYFSLQIISGLQVSIGGTTNGFGDPDWAGTFQGAQAIENGAAVGQLGTFPFFILAIIFMAASLVVANKLGADGGAKAVSMGKSFGNRVRNYTGRAAGGATLGVGARLGRNTVGRWSNNYAESDKAKSRAANSYLGKLQYKAAQKLGGASFDARQVGGSGKALGIGEGVTGGYAKRIKDAKEEQKKFVGKDGLGFVDIEEGEGKEKVDTLSAKYAAEAAKKKAEAELTGEEFEKDQLESEATLTSAINALADEIKNKEDALSAGNLTTKEKESLENDITTQKQRLSAKKENLDSVKLKDQWLIARNKSNRINASSTATDEEKLQARQAFQDAEKAYSNAQRNRQRQIENAKKAAEKEAANSENRAKAEVKFERQIAYMERLKKQKAAWGVLGNKVTGPGATAVGGAFGALGGIYGAAGAAGAAARADELEELIKELDKEYGKGGTKTIGKEKSKNKAKDLIEAMDDLGETKKDKASDESKKET